MSAPRLSAQDRLLPFHHLKPGEIYVSSTPTLVSTVLGSCVSVTMYSARAGLGAICHGLLPECGGRGCEDCVEKLKYVDCSIKHLANGFERKGIKKNEIVVKMFGGGDVLPQTRTHRKRATVGRQNIDVAYKVLRELDFALCVSDVGGKRGRKIFFYTHTGQVLLKRLGKGGNAGLLSCSREDMMEIEEVS